MPVVEMRGIVKRFGAIAACDGIDFDIQPGEVHALLGENGAGKTTLMRLLYGLFKADAGEILIDGSPVALSSPSVAITHGIGMVHQHFLLVPTMSVLENYALGRSSLTSSVPRAISREQAESVRSRYGLWVDPDRLVHDLPVGLQQRVEIIRSLCQGASVLILDEPTAVLTPQEANELFEGLKTFAAAGNSVVFISHKLKEVMAVSDRVTVLRRGKVVDEAATGDTSVDELAAMMTGHWRPTQFNRGTSAPGPVALSARGLYVLDDEGRPSVRDLDFDVHAGEILGVAGVDGNGQSEMTQALWGLRPLMAGTVKLGGVDITRASVRERVRRGIGHIPDDRNRWGLFLQLRMSDNLTSERLEEPRFSSWGVVRRTAIDAHAHDLVQRFEIVPPDINAPTGALSGGNQQKVVVARAVSHNPQVVIASHPTRGLDVMAADFVRRAIVAERDRGAAVLLVSADLDEVLAISDRVAVMYEGRFVGTVNPATTSLAEVGLLMAGIHPGTATKRSDAGVEIDPVDLL